MRIAIIGMGGIGGYFGGKLATAYVPSGLHQVYFVARGEHLARIREEGINVKADDGDFTAFPTLATDRPAEIGKVDFVMFCVKSYDFEEAARGMEGIIGDHTFVLPLQNGVDKRGWMERVLGKGIVLDGCVYMAVHIESPGVIRQAGGSRKLIFGRDPQDVSRLKPLADLLLGAGIKAEMEEDIRLPVWAKYIVICPMAAATSYYRETVGAILADPEKKAFLEGLTAEVENVARILGVAYPADIFKKTMDTISSFPYETKTSMQRDFELGKRNELETFSGAIVRMGREAGVGTPLHSMVYEALK
ncbi:MAG: ketopantoate reductase family protein [Desulfocucumaceae bacterium]